MTAIIYGEQNDMKAIRAFQRWLRQIERKKPLRRFGVRVAPNDRRSVTRKEKRVTPTVGGRQLPAYKGPILDRRGRQGVFVGIEYDGAKRHAFGVARRRVLYDINPDHCEKDAYGRAMFFSNMGRDELEIATAADVIETTQRATRANAKVGVNIIVQLPHDVSQEARLEIMRRISQELFAQHGLPFVASLHEPSADGDQRNYHGHIWAAWRPVERTAPFEWKISEDFRSDLDGDVYWRHARRAIAETITVVAQSQGLNRTYTHLSNAERGLVHKPQAKLGKVKTEQSRRDEFVAVNIANARTIAANEHAEAKLKAVREKRARIRRERLRQIQNGITRELTPIPAVPRTPSITPVSQSPMTSVTLPASFASALRSVTLGTGPLAVIPKPMTVPVISAVAEPYRMSLAPMVTLPGPAPILPSMQPVSSPPSIDVSSKLTPVRSSSEADINAVPVAVISKAFVTTVRSVSVVAQSNLGSSMSLAGVTSISLQGHAQSISPAKYVQVPESDRRNADASLEIADGPSNQAKVVALDLPTFNAIQLPRLVAPVAPFDGSTILPIPAVRRNSRIEIKPVEAAVQQGKLRPQMVQPVVSPAKVQPVRETARFEVVKPSVLANPVMHPVAPISIATPIPFNVRPFSPVIVNRVASRRELVTMTPVKPVGRQISPVAISPQISAVARSKIHKPPEIAPIASASPIIRAVGTVNPARLSTPMVMKVATQSAQADAALLDIVKLAVPVKPVSVKPVPAMSPIKTTAVTLPRPVAVVVPLQSMGQTIRPTRVQAAVDITAVSMSPVSPVADSQKPFVLPALVRPVVAKQAWISVAPVNVAKQAAANVRKIEPLVGVRRTAEQSRMMPVPPVRLPEYSKPTAVIPVAVKSGRDAEAEELFRQTHAAMMRLAAEIDRRKADLARLAFLNAPDLPTYAQICFAEAAKQPLDYRIDRLAASMGRGRCELVMAEDGVVEPKVAIIESWGLTRPDIASPRCQKLLLRQYIHQQIEADQLELELSRQISTPGDAFAANLLSKVKLSARAKATANAHYRDGLFGVIRQRIVERSFRGKHVPTRKEELRSRGITIDGLSPWVPPRDPREAPLQRLGLNADGPSL